MVLFYQCFEYLFYNISVIFGDNNSYQITMPVCDISLKIIWLKNYLIISFILSPFLFLVYSQQFSGVNPD